ncbi:hypothetical protein LTZ12_13130 [Lacticaseibacillus paracasei]|uniref:hypothetical protein n=1 Tax=Lacticaseibacillus paracasei TaxID=1597 RepID=UPI00237F2EDB|nr:hypothetical protein [Lacticaseibacillus paracasei]MDE3305806.1 hypothetical protein [Lacticaseibacillus paracasei]
MKEQIKNGISRPLPSGGKIVVMNDVATRSIPTAYQPKAANNSSHDLLAVGIIRRYFCVLCTLCQLIEGIKTGVTMKLFDDEEKQTTTHCGRPIYTFEQIKWFILLCHF